MFPVHNIRELKYKQNNMRQQISRQKINQYLKSIIMMSQLNSFYLGRLISYRNIFILQTELQILPFKWDMSQLSSMFVARYIIQTILGTFFLDTLYSLLAVCTSFLSTAMLSSPSNSISLELSNFKVIGNFIITFIYTLFKIHMNICMNILFDIYMNIYMI